MAVPYGAPLHQIRIEFIGFYTFFPKPAFKVLGIDPVALRARQLCDCRSRELLLLRRFRVARYFLPTHTGAPAGTTNHVRPFSRLDTLKASLKESDLPIKVDVVDWHHIAPEFRDGIGDLRRLYLWSEA